uniref:Small ribosomal subunit protein uS14c n=1 Tax=Acrochaetium secundatum TaxID=209631 RepID=A0A4D6BK64_9FLOR|nr:ribosomal protein S14 [Acrochaetium secundatum]QBX88426.1 ribosomal protein S14 [Acrochaetium secundatum]
MAKKSMKQREAKRVKLVNKYRNKRAKLKIKIKESNSFDEQLLIQEQLQKLPRDSVQSRLRNRCWLTGRSRGVYSDFGLSRHVLREMAHECLLPGVTKSSW